MDGNLDYIVKALEAKKRVASNGEFFWTGRDLAENPDSNTADWRNFRDVIEKAKEASNNAGIFSNDHFVEFTEEITDRKGREGETRERRTESAGMLSRCHEC